MTEKEANLIPFPTSADFFSRLREENREGDLIGYVFDTDNEFNNRFMRRLVFVAPPFPTLDSSKLRHIATELTRGFLKVEAIVPSHLSTVSEEDMHGITKYKAYVLTRAEIQLPGDFSTSLFVFPHEGIADSAAETILESDTENSNFRDLINGCVPHDFILEHFPDEDSAHVSPRKEPCDIVDFLTWKTARGR